MVKEQNQNTLPPENEEPEVPSTGDADNLPPEEGNLPPQEDDNDEVVAEKPQDEQEADPDETPEQLSARLERLGGEPAPDITPEEFARLQQAGQIHIDPRGRVRSRDSSVPDIGVSLRKRRAWYC
jgi:hypothetical protein